jgi:hypothetical protein
MTCLFILYVSPTLHMVTMLYYYITDNQERQTLNLPDLLQHKIVFKVFSDTIVLPVPSQTILNNVFSFCSNFNEIYLESTKSEYIIKYTEIWIFSS